MNKNTVKHKVSVKRYLAIFFAFFIFTIVGSHVYTVSSFKQLEKYQLVVEKSSKNKDLVEEIVIYANRIIQGDNSVKTLLIDDIAVYNNNLQLIKEGGEVVINNEEVYLPPCEKKALPTLEEITRLWKEYKAKVEDILVDDIFIKFDNKKVLTQSAKEAISYLEQNRATLVALNTEFEDTYRQIANDNRNSANLLLWVILAINVMLILFGIYLLNTLLIKPLNKITKVAEKISQGSLEHKVNYSSQNEVGFVARAINSMVDKIKNATTFIKSIEDGNLEVSYQGANGLSTAKDTLAGALINMREKMKSVAVEESERSWVNEGAALFGEILQTYNDNTETLSFQIISNLVKYTNASQGGLFLINEEERHLDLMASYAFNRRRYFDKKVEIGEGLVGQAYKDADTIYLTDIPENYVNITSGLGGEQPKSVLVVPLKMNESVYGVAELASFRDFKSYQIRFLEDIGENIATNLYTSRASEKTKELLANSTKITEQMRLQEQKMLKSLQELEDTKQKMQQNQETLASQSNAIRSTLITVELDIHHRILSVNDIFLDSLDYISDEDLLGVNHKQFIPDNPTSQSNYEKLWKSLLEGETQSGEFKFVDRNREDVWLRATYTPIKNKEGNIEKILKLAFDITEDKKLRLDFQEQIESFKRSSPIVEFDLKGNIIDCNELFLELTEYSREEVIGLNHTMLIPKEDLETSTYKALWHKLSQGHYHIGQIRRISKTGKILWLQGSFNPILDLNGKPYKVIEFMVNITERKKVEEDILATQRELQRKEANLTALINSTDDAIYTITPNYRLRMMNESTPVLFEKLGASVRIGTNMLDILPKNYLYIWKGYYDKALSGEKFSVEQAVFSDLTSEKFYLSISFNPIIDKDNRVGGVVAFARDITQKKLRELEIADFAKKQAERTSRIIDNQKKTLEENSVRFKEEKASLENELHSLKRREISYQERLRLFYDNDIASLIINHDFQIVDYNPKAKETLLKWHFYLQPNYLLLDIFHIKNFYEWRDILRNALNGSRQNIELGIPHHKLKKVFYFAITLSPILDDQHNVDFVGISIQDITRIKTENKKLNRAKRKRLIQRQAKLAKGALKEVEKERKSIALELQVKEEETARQNRLIELLNNTEDILLEVAEDLTIKSYGQKAKALFYQWRLYLQPDYLLTDVFPLEKFYEWKNLCQKAIRGEEFAVKQAIVNRKEHKIYYFRISFEQIEDSDNIIIRIKDQTHLGKNFLNSTDKEDSPQIINRRI